MTLLQLRMNRARNGDCASALFLYKGWSELRSKIYLSKTNWEIKQRNKDLFVLSNARPIKRSIGRKKSEYDEKMINYSPDVLIYSFDLLIGL